MAWTCDYATVGELRSYVRAGDSADDAQLALAIATASREIDRACNRQFGQVPAPTARYYPQPRWDRRRLRWVVEIDDLMTTTGLAVAYDSTGDETWATAVTAYLLRPVNAAADGLPWTQLTLDSSAFGTTPGLTILDLIDAQAGLPPLSLFAPREDAVRVTARWGWAGVPDAIRQACLLQASRLLARRDSPFGVAGSPEVGSELRLLAKLDADVAVTLRPYRRAWGAV